MNARRTARRRLVVTPWRRWRLCLVGPPGAAERLVDLAATVDGAGHPPGR